MNRRTAFTFSGLLVAVAIAIAVAFGGVLAVRGQDSTELAPETGSSAAAVETAKPSSSIRGFDPSGSVDSAAGQQSEPASQGLPLQSSRVVEVDYDRFSQLLPRDAIAPIYEPRFSSAQDAALDPDDLVIGIKINGESRAYAIGRLSRREMVNDVVGGVPILVT